MMSLAPDDLTGALLGGRYRVVRLVGRGGMGAVYEGLQEDLGRRVAIKVLHPHLAVSAEVVERFRREAQSTAALGHPNIVQVTDCRWEPGGPLYLVMELLTGRSLGYVIATEGRLASRRVAFIASQLLDALAAAHRAGIVHRDVKPDNVFLTSIAQVHDVVKVLDFGVAKLVGGGPEASLTSTGVAVGTPFYMAPEQARGLPVDPRTDVYAVGVCMYHALTGRLPFAAPSFNALMFAIAEQEPSSVLAIAPDVDPGVAAVVTRAMSKNPARRFASAGEMAAALAPWSSPTTTISVKPPGSFHADANAPTLVAATPSFDGAQVATQGSRSSGSAWIVVGSAALIVLVVAIAIANLLVTKHTRSNRPAAPDATPIASTSASAPGAASPPPSAEPLIDAGRARSDGGHAFVVDAAAPHDADVPRDAEPPPAPGRRQIHASFWQTTDCCELAALRSSIAAISGATTACVGANPPQDKFPMYDLRVTTAGQVTSAIVLGGAKPGDGPFHACMQAALRRVSVGPTLPTCQGSVRVGFNAE